MLSLPSARFISFCFYNTGEYLLNEVPAAISSSPTLQMTRVTVYEKPLIEIGWEYLCTKPGRRYKVGRPYECGDSQWLVLSIYIWGLYLYLGKKLFQLFYQVVYGSWLLYATEGTFIDSFLLKAEIYEGGIKDDWDVP